MRVCSKPSLASSKYIPGARLYSEGNQMFAWWQWVVECPAFFLLDEEEAPALCSSLKSLPLSLILEDIAQVLRRKPFYCASLLPIVSHSYSPLRGTEYTSDTCNHHPTKEASSLTPNAWLQNHCGWEETSSGQSQRSHECYLLLLYSLQGVLTCQLQGVNSKRWRKENTAQIRRRFGFGIARLWRVGWLLLHGM